MVTKEKINSILSSYRNVAVATICSHSSLQIFYGAKEEGLKTIGIVKKGKLGLYKSFPYAKPDEFIIVDDYSDLPADELVARNAIIIPHGSFIEYMGERVDSLPVPLFGNRASLQWERNRNRMFHWMKKAGLKVPKIYKPDQIDGPVIVKFPGAKGGQGYVIVNSQEEFRRRVGDKPCIIQEFIVGIRAYPHYFFSPISDVGYKTRNGRLELMGIDRRIESNADEIARALSAATKTEMTFTVVGNEAMTLRESLLEEVMEMGKRVSDASQKLFGGIYGPFCIETMITEELDIYTFEISARIVAGTNLFLKGSPYSWYYYNAPVSMGRRIAMELKSAFKKKRLNEIVY